MSKGVAGLIFILVIDLMVNIFGYTTKLTIFAL